MIENPHPLHTHRRSSSYIYKDFQHLLLWLVVIRTKHRTLMATIYISIKYQRVWSGWSCILMSCSRCRRCWIALYMYKEDLLWVWSGCEASIIRTHWDSSSYTQDLEYILLLLLATAKSESNTTLSLILAGNVLFCRVFPSLHLQTWRVVSATCRRHVFGHVADTRKCCVGHGVETTRHLKTTCRDMSSNVCNNVIAFLAQTQKLYGS
jgi:hypothetical protein